ncbi:MAG: hypothetical protein IPF54_26440 [Draconibacterium sp.]|nr:hypothetical protein [Draconibacterium sp.]
MESIKDSSKQYSLNIQKLNGNLSTLNSNFESQLKGTEEQLKASQNFSKDLMAMNSILASSVDELKNIKKMLNSSINILNH